VKAKFCGNGGKGEDDLHEALSAASGKLAEASAALTKLKAPPAAVRLLGEEVRDVLVRVKEQQAQAEG
jgi:hypothetical protein